MNYCPLVWMFCCRGIMHKMNKSSHEQFLRYYWKTTTSSGDISIHQRLINLLLTEVYKYIHGLSPEITNVIFSTKANIYNTRQFNVSETHIPTSNRYRLSLVPYKAKQLWDLLTENLKSSPSLTLFFVLQKRNKIVGVL